jgi:hypothetical protein
MKPIKSERLKKLESELRDLEQWLKLGLVPKKDLEKHKEEISALQNKIEEEKERLQFLKESGEGEEYITPKRPTTRSGYTEMPTIPDIDIGETAATYSDSSFESDNEPAETTTVNEDYDEEEEATEGEVTEVAGEEKEEKDDEDEDNDSYFSDRSRWRRGGIVDPEADNW